VARQLLKYNIQSAPWRSEDCEGQVSDSGQAAQTGYRGDVDAASADLISRLVSATDRLLQPGSPFEMKEEEVLGQPMQVFAARERSFRAMLDRSRAFGGAEFLVFEGGPRVTFAEFHEQVTAAARVLRSEFGLSKGDRIGICAQNGPGWILASCGALAMGAVVVALNSWWTSEELRSALDLTEPALVVVDTRRREILPDGWPSEVELDDDFVQKVQSAVQSDDTRAEVADVGEDDPAVSLFTSGTSGRPKAAVLSHRCVLGFVQLSAFIGARSMLLSGGVPDSAPAVRLAVFPMFHISGFGSFLGALAFGNKTVWPRGRFDADRIIGLSEQEGITVWSGASTHIARLLDSPRFDRLDGTRLRQVGIGGSATTPNLIANAEERLPHLKDTFASGYGMTESGGLVSYAPNFLLKMDADCVGPPLPTIDVRIEREDGSRAAEGEVGVICVKSPIVMLGYWGADPQDGGVLNRERWLRTEDYGRLEDGLLFVASRIRDLIIRGGENIYPTEVERCLESHEDVVEAAVYGRESDEFGQTVEAAVYLRAGSASSASQIRAYCAERLAYFKVPETVVIRADPLPKNATGKVLKRLLETEAPLAGTS
jgi:long-chain acyl-CoA synthetase